MTTSSETLDITYQHYFHSDTKTFFITQERNLCFIGTQNELRYDCKFLEKQEISIPKSSSGKGDSLRICDRMTNFTFILEFKVGLLKIQNLHCSE